MAARRKKVATDVSTTRAFTVVVEEMRGHFKVFGEQLGALRDTVTELDDKVTVLDHKVTALDHKVTVLDHKVTALDHKVTALDNRVTALDNRVTALDHKVAALDDKVTAGFAQVDLRFERVEHEVGLLKVAVIEQGRELKKKVDRDEVEAIVERVVARAARQ
jgi:chromosome segregation ATPase